MKKTMALFIGFTAVMLSAFSAWGALWGDANGDEKISSDDAAYVLQRVLDDSYSMSAERAAYCDVDLSGTLTSNDAAEILRKTRDGSYMMPCEVKGGALVINANLTGGLKAGDNSDILPGLYAGEKMVVKPDYDRDVKFVQGTNNPTDANGVKPQGNIPVKGAYIKYTAPDNGVLTAAIRTNGGKSTYVIYSDTRLIDFIDCTSDPDGVMSYYELEMTKGQEIYIYSVGSKVCIYRMGFVYGTKADVPDLPEYTTMVTTTKETESTEKTTREQNTNIEFSTETTTLDPKGVVVKDFAALKNAVAAKGAVVYVGGDISCPEQLNLSTANANVSIIGIIGNDGKLPRLDFSSAGKIGGKATGIYIKGSYYNLKNLIVENAPNCGMRITGSGSGHCNLENCVFRYNGNCGASVTYGGEYNTFRNCYSYRNCDLNNGGSDADGFGVKLTPGKGNTFYGCMAWENGDDGWDSYAMPYDLSYEECACWNNGNPKAFTGELDFEEGNPLDKKLVAVQAILAKYPDFEDRYNEALANGTDLQWPTDVSVSFASGSKTIASIKSGWGGNPNGFKYGSYATNHENGQVEATAYRKIKNCLSFNHGGKGFDQNNCYASFDLENTVAFDNGGTNGKPNYMMGRMTCLSCVNAVGFKGYVSDELPENMTVTTPDEARQAEIRSIVAKTRNNVLDHVYNDITPGEILFDIYK